MKTVGLVGVGGMGVRHAEQYAKIGGVRLVAFGKQPDKLAAFCSKFGAEPAKDIRDLIERSDIVDICLPTDLHHAVGMEAIASGRAVLMEKPMACTLAEAEELAEAAERAGVPFMPAQVVRFFPEFEQGHKLVASGAVGTPAAARTRRGGGFPVGENSWFRDFSRSGGILLDLAIHDFDWMRWTLGPVAEVHATSLAQTYPDRIGSDGDYALSLLRFESGCIGHVESTWMDPHGFRVAFEVCGSDGMIEYDSRRTGTIFDGRAWSPHAAGEDPYHRQIKAFLDAVTTGSALPVTASDGIEALRISAAAQQSAYSGKPVMLSN